MRSELMEALPTEAGCAAPAPQASPCETAENTAS
jgi:hypothetical protein